MLWGELPFYRVSGKAIYNLHEYFQTLFDQRKRIALEKNDLKVEKGYSSVGIAKNYENN